MSRRNLPVAVAAACFVVLLAATVFAAQSSAPAAQPAAAATLSPVPAQDGALDPAAEAPASGQCLPESLVLPEPLLLAGNQTCDECLADCEARETRCYEHCTGRNCIMKCYGQYLQCASNCPC